MNFKIIHVDWNEHRKELSEIRRKVFIEEQHVPEELEWDEFDAISFHVLALDLNNHPIATGRLKPDGQIGRMAVLKEWRNLDVGRALLETLLNYAIESGIDKVYLHAQITAIGFYKNAGFSINSKEFMDAGIPHKTMIKSIR